mmetsp:Transcript_12304/g.18934  ORF Transcript_12304/g.18934 Transcript_12304/m.18934 type:complete len:107 (+) Transcript_12304:276-596(+)
MLTATCGAERKSWTEWYKMLQNVCGGHELQISHDKLRANASGGRGVVLGAPTTCCSTQVNKKEISLKHQGARLWHIPAWGCTGALHLKALQLRHNTQEPSCTLKAC